MANAIDLTTIANVKQIVGVETPGTDDQASGNIQLLITALSRYVVSSVLSRRNVNISAQLTDVYDGSGSDKLMLRDYPVTAVASVSVFNSLVPQSPDGLAPGWIFDETSIMLLPNTSIGAPLSNWNYILGRFPRGRRNVTVVYTAGYTAGTNPPADANFNGAPTDLGTAVTWLVAQEYKRRNWLGQASKTLSEAHEQVVFTMDEWPKWVQRVMMAYRRDIWT